MGTRSGCFKCQAGNLRGCHLVGLVVGAGGGSPPIGNSLDIFLETVYKLNDTDYVCISMEFQNLNA